MTLADSAIRDRVGVVAATHPNASMVIPVKVEGPNSMGVPSLTRFIRTDTMIRGVYRLADAGCEPLEEA